MSVQFISISSYYHLSKFATLPFLLPVYLTFRLFHVSPPTSYFNFLPLKASLHHCSSHSSLIHGPHPSPSCRKKKDGRIRNPDKGTEMRKDGKKWVVWKNTERHSELRNKWRQKEKNVGKDGENVWDVVSTKPEALNLTSHGVASGSRIVKTKPHSLWKTPIWLTFCLCSRFWPFDSFL